LLGTAKAPQCFTGTFQRKNGINPMSKQDEYRRAAKASLELAETAGNQTEKMRMLRMAEAWCNLAERAARLPQAVSISDHPLVSQVLGGK
jgi:hypothetical protein